MLKKILIAGLFVVLIGVLIWGGVTRTLAKSGNEVRGNQKNQAVESGLEGRNSLQGRWEQQGQVNYINEERQGRGGPPAEHDEDCENESSQQTFQNFGKNSSALPDQETGRGFRGGQNSTEMNVVSEGRVGYGPSPSGPAISCRTASV